MYDIHYENLIRTFDYIDNGDKLLKEDFKYGPNVDKLGKHLKKIVAKFATEDASPFTIFESRHPMRGMVLFEVNKKVENAIAIVNDAGYIDVINVLPAEKAERLAALRAANERRFLERIGFTRFFRLLTENRDKVYIGHNCLLDLLFLYSHFKDTLPIDYFAFKQSIKVIFPRLFDTKVIVNSFLKEIIPGNSSSLQTVIDELEKTDIATKVPITLHPDFSAKYTGENKSYHEAAYDSLITAKAFLYLRVFLGERETEACNKVFMLRSNYDIDINKREDNFINIPVNIFLLQPKKGQADKLKEDLREIFASFEKGVYIRNHFTMDKTLYVAIAYEAVSYTHLTLPTIYSV
eukprot:TRINITY_DN3734_c0_g1_i6.p1 TRINITY_DN3734_c0_g1~~TRINITY_DN3734_c0_g1_i6.p1  ORF type:complete len:350 (-),score=74.86 TRINITY_DN3734_c0_g1_i6:36-1085(-)